MPSENAYYYSLRGIWHLWAGILIGPAAVVLTFQTNYILVNFACESGWWLALHMLPVLGLVMSLGGVVLSRRMWHDNGAEWSAADAGVTPRSRFMAVGGAVLSAGCALLIVALWIPAWIVSPCAH